MIIDKKHNAPEFKIRFRRGYMIDGDLRKNALVLKQERDLIAEKMAMAGIRNRETYLRKMSLGGYIIRLNFSAVKK